jgi:hemolysin-activating ACP:hemolysin acyltransferase
MELTNEEKQSIVNQHIKSVLTNIYNLQVSLIAEEAVEPVNQSAVDVLSDQISKELLRHSALMSEFESIQE